jgi:DNA polymerase-1
MTTLLVDADIVLYRAASSVECEVEFEEDVWVLWTDENEALEAFHNSLTALCEQANTNSYLLCFSDSSNFRKSLYSDYKGNRTQRKPMGFKAIRERVFEEYKDKVIVWPWLEADDVIGIYATTYPDMLIWSADKDLRQIPGKHVTEFGIVDISQQEADRWFYTQTLIGDTADNYKGCPGIGPVKAENIIKLAEGTGKEWFFVVAAYLKAGLTEADALVQARLARILRASDWDESKQEVKLWTPTTA